MTVLANVPRAVTIRWHQEAPHGDTPSPGQGTGPCRAPGVLGDPATERDPEEHPPAAALSRHPVPPQGHHRQARGDDNEALGAGAEFRPAATSILVLAGALFPLISAAAACAAPITRAWPQGWRQVWGRFSDPRRP